MKKTFYLLAIISSNLFYSQNEDTIVELYADVTNDNKEEKIIIKELKEGGKLILIRHSEAPGTGDPANFNINDCKTQRNLSSNGIEQAKRMGEFFIKNNIPFEREKEFKVKYKDVFLKHKFYADFVVFDNIILEIKTVECFNASHYNQCLNYLKISGYQLAILANFNLISLEYKRIIDSKKK